LKGVGAPIRSDEAAASIIPRRKSQEQRGKDHSQGFVSIQLNKGVLYFNYQKSSFANKHRGIYTINRPPIWVQIRNRKEKIDCVKGFHEMNSWRVPAWLLAAQSSVFWQ
jgi:hypothetical protein